MKSHSYIAENIICEYRRRKRYESNKKRMELRNFQKENCMNCKNKNTQLCKIEKDSNNKLQCKNKEI